MLLQHTYIITNEHILVNHYLLDFGLGLPKFYTDSMTQATVFSKSCSNSGYSWSNCVVVTVRYPLFHFESISLPISRPVHSTTLCCNRAPRRPHTVRYLCGQAQLVPGIKLMQTQILSVLVESLRFQPIN